VQNSGNYQRLMDLLHISTIDELKNSHKKWIEEVLKTKNYVRESKWTQSIAVGSKSFVDNIKEKLGIRAKGRKVEGSRDLYHLREAQAAYNSNFTPNNSDLRAKNTYIWSYNP
jgi:putative transposase